MTKRIFLKLLLAFSVAIAAAMVITAVAVHKAWTSSIRQEITRNLTEKAVLFAQRVNVDRQHSLQEVAAQAGHAAGARATIIDADGKVLADSESSNVRVLDNLGKYPEVSAALKGEMGMDSRRTGKLGVPTLLVAAPIAGGAVRLEYSLSDMENATAPLNRIVLFSAAAAFVVAVIVAAWLAKAISSRVEAIVEFAEQIASGNLETRFHPKRSSGMAELASALDNAAGQLESRFAQLRSSQHELETLLNSMQDAVVAVDPELRVQWSNERMNRIIPQGTRLGVRVVETVRDPDFLRAVRAASESRNVMTAKANSISPGRSYEVTAAPMPGGGTVAVLRDLTETERVEKTRRDFIANVSHELRTPLTSIQGYAETLLDSAPENNHVRDFLEIIRKNATRMARLTEDLLTLARVESGEQRFETLPVTAGELLQEAVQSFDTVARTHGVELRVEDTSTEPVSADREAIHQVFSNLIDNAIKYGGSNKRICLGARPSARGTEFYVRDFGPGIPSEHLARLFERFYRVDKARSRESGGTGLGLAIAKHIVLAHSGTIRAESELNHGSTFLFTLPSATAATASGQV